jgi:transketolase
MRYEELKAILAKNNDVEEIEMRQVYAQTMKQMFGENEKVLALDADLLFASGMRENWHNFPDRVFECGIAEANMFGVAAGLSKEGFIPFIHTFAAFATRRALDQLYMSCAYSLLNVKVMGSDPGIASALNGGTHAGNEDIGHIRSIPGISIVEPTDSTMLHWAIREAADKHGIFYIRMFRMKANKIYEENSQFTLGKAVKLREGSDLTIIASGLEVLEALKAADTLAKEGISARVLDMFTIKPIDEEAIVQAAEETGAIVTAENHNMIGGLGSAVAEVLATKSPAPLERIGINEVFGEVGPIDYLRRRFELTDEDIVKKAKTILSRK